MNADVDEYNTDKKTPVQTQTVFMLKILSVIPELKESNRQFAFTQKYLIHVC